MLNPGAMAGSRNFAEARMAGKSEHSATQVVLHKETDEAYADVVTHLRPDLRIIICREGIQWIVQRLAGGRWRAFAYGLTKAGLIRACARFLARERVAERLAHLPDYCGEGA